MTLNWMTLLLFPALFNTLIGLGGLLYFYKEEKKGGSGWLTGVLISVGIILTEQFYRQTCLIDHYPFLLFISTPVFFCFLPLIFCWQKRLNGEKTRWPFHFIIPFLVLLLMLPTYLMPADEKLAMYYAPDNTDPPWIVLFYVLFWLGYLMAIFRYQLKYARQLKNERSDNQIEEAIFFNRIITVTGAFSLVFPLAISVQYVGWEPATHEKIQQGLYLVFSLSAHFLMLVILLTKGRLFTVSEKMPEPSAGNTLSRLEKKKETLQHFMTTQKLFLRNDLSLPALAETIHWSRSELSAVINQGFDQNFYDFINSLRVEEVIRRLENGDHRQYSLDYIVREAGFNSYTTFYRVFKKFKGTTPTQYIKSMNIPGV